MQKEAERKHPLKTGIDFSQARVTVDGQKVRLPEGTELTVA